MSRTPSQDGVQVNVYELNVYRSYAIDVCYYDGDTLLKTETAYTGYEFTPNYIPTITGYTFNDWNYTPKVLWDDLELYVDKTANTYTVAYDVNGGDELTTTEKTVTYDSEYTLTKPTKTGYTFLGWYYGDTQLTGENGKSLAVWNYEKNLTAKAKWQANEYAVTLETNNSSSGTVSGASNYAYNSNVTITATTNNGYIWLGWYDKNDELVSSELSYTFKMGFAVKYTAKWSKVAITIERNDASAGSVTSLSGKYINGQEITVTATTNSGYTWLGWYNGDTLLTAENSYTFTMNEEAKTYTAKWTYYTVMTNTNLNGAGTYTSYTDKKITVDTETTLTATTNSGYTWLGWYDGDTLLTDELNYTFTMKAENVTYTAKWTYYTLTTNASLSGAGAYASCSNKKVTVGTETTLTATINSGYIWLGWYDGETLLTSELSYTFEMPAENVTYTAKWSKVAITLSRNNTSAGSVTSLSGKYMYGQEVTVTATTNSGYTWLGWYNDDILLTTETSYIFTISVENKTYTAKWAVGEEMSVFSFSSTETTCSIMGVKDTTVTELVVPDYVTSISLGAFSGCSSLTSITLPFVGGKKSATSESSSTVFGYIFGSSIYTGGASTEQYYTLYDSATYYIPKSLKSVTITGGNIFYGAFYNCINLTSITIPNSVTSIEPYTFYNCNSLMDAYYTGDIESWCGILFGGYMSNPTFYAENLYINGVLLKGTLVIPNGVSSINAYAFYNCSDLTSIKIPDSVTNIGEFAFYNCSDLTSVIIGNGVTSIGRNVFSACSNLMSITFSDNSTWYRTSSYSDWSSKFGGTSTDITNSATNAVYFTLTYDDFFWYKNK